MAEFNSYYMLIAIAVRERSSCKGRHVGAVIVKNNRIISTGYNGTPEGMENCGDGGCARCANSKKYRKGTFYDKCICVHAEQNAIVTAARFGHSIDGAVIYTTLQPCFSCLKESLQAKIKTIYYIEELNSKRDEAEIRKQYKIIQSRFNKVPSKIELHDLPGMIKNMLQYVKEKRLAK